MSEPSGSSPIPWLTPAEYAEWRAAYAEELANGRSDEGQVLRRAGERTAHLWGFRTAPDGTPVLNPDRLSPEIYAEMKAAQPEPQSATQQQDAALRGGAERQPDLAPELTLMASPGSGQAAQGMAMELDFPSPPGARPPAGVPGRLAGPRRTTGQPGQPARRRTP